MNYRYIFGLLTMAVVLAGLVYFISWEPKSSPSPNPSPDRITSDVKYHIVKDRTPGHFGDYIVFESSTGAIAVTRRY